MGQDISITPEVDRTEPLDVEEPTPDTDAPVVITDEPAPEVVFAVRDLDVYYGAFRAVRDVNIDVNRYNQFNRTNISNGPRRTSQGFKS